MSEQVPAEVTKDPWWKVAREKSRRLDWGPMEKWYVEGEMVGGLHVYPRMEQIAQKLDVTLNACYQYAQRHGWGEKRAELQRERENTQLAIMLKAQVLEPVKFDILALHASGLVIQEAAKTISKAREKQETLPAATLRSLATAISTAHVTGRLAIGRSTQINETNMSVRMTEEQIDNLPTESVQKLLAAREVLESELKTIVVDMEDPNGQAGLPETQGGAVPQDDPGGAGAAAGEAPADGGPAEGDGRPEEAPEGST